MELTKEQIFDLSKDRICVYCKERKCNKYLDACDFCSKKAYELGCEVEEVNLRCVPALKEKENAI